MALPSKKQARPTRRRTKAKDEAPAPVRRSPERTGYLLDVATKFFLKKGFEGASVGEMARYARASKETFYSRYPTKGDLFRAVMIRRTQRRGPAVSAMLAPEVLPNKALTDIGELVFNRVLHKDVIAIQRAIAAEAKRFPELGQIFYEHGPEWMMTMLAGYLKEQIARGRLRSMDTEVAARQFLYLSLGEFQMRAYLGIGPKPSKRIQQSRVAAAVEVFLRAYQA